MPRSFAIVIYLILEHIIYTSSINSPLTVYSINLSFKYFVSQCNCALSFIDGLCFAVVLNSYITVVLCLGLTLD